MLRGHAERAAHTKKYPPHATEEPTMLALSPLYSDEVPSHLQITSERGRSRSYVQPSNREPRAT